MIRGARGSTSLLALTLVGCASSASAPAPGFEQTMVELCDPETRGVPVHTVAGGYLVIEVIDPCGVALQRCQGPDFFAAGATATLRVAGTDLLVEGCSIPAMGGSRLRASFLGEGSATPGESYEVALVAECLPTPRGCGSDAGAPPADGGTATDASTTPDSGGEVDAGAPSDAS